MIIQEGSYTCETTSDQAQKALERNVIPKPNSMHNLIINKSESSEVQYNIPKHTPIHHILIQDCILNELEVETVSIGIEHYLVVLKNTEPHIGHTPFLCTMGLKVSI